ncbi:MAG: DEAD/DEAH box helicase, partial [Polyangiaceae bacterium]
MATESREANFKSFFATATGGFQPYRWQLQIALDGLPEVLPVPTGLGKTEVALAWAWRRFEAREAEPLHLVFCLPMRSLVTQTTERLRKYFEMLRAVRVDVGVYQLMGGAIDGEWARQPDKPWVLVGTQDQLLSRALNRGYAMSRFEWPVHFGLLNNDCHWIIDEVQLMGPGLWTTSQLDWMRRKRFPSLKPCRTTWMSATVGTSFLRTTDRAREELGEPSQEHVAFEVKLQDALRDDENLNWWRRAKRPIEWWRPEGVVRADTVAEAVVKNHQAGTLSLVIFNTVDIAR